MIKAILFDFGYTITSGFKNRDKKINKILAPFGLNWRKLLPLWRNLYILRSAGKIKSDKELEFLMRRITKKEIPVKKIIEFTIENHFIPKENVEIIKKLKKEYKIGILSNNVQGWVMPILKNYKINDLFDVVIISSKIGARKPDGVIYYEALKKLSIRADQAVFIADELSEDLVAATGLRMRTIWLKNKKKGWWRKNDEKVLKIYKPDAIIKSLREVASVVKNLKNHEN
ncbi:MAG: HAD family hydrolase [Candidatus Nealsonbacteria bacterium]|nr:HAD family hydrolase [Candidatus Nealsonbacteria bacterium]